jgi:hypothetical protein
MRFNKFVVVALYENMVIFLSRYHEHELSRMIKHNLIIEHTRDVNKSAYATTDLCKQKRTRNS